MPITVVTTSDGSCCCPDPWVQDPSQCTCHSLYPTGEVAFCLVISDGDVYSHGNYPLTKSAPCQYNGGSAPEAIIANADNFGVASPKGMTVSLWRDFFSGNANRATYYLDPFNCTGTNVLPKVSQIGSMPGTYPASIQVNAGPCPVAGAAPGLPGLDPGITSSITRAGANPLETYACRHRQDYTGHTVPCHTCTGNVNLKVFGCTVHELCVIDRQVPPLQTCSLCPDRNPPEEPE